MSLHFIETVVFTRRIAALGLEPELRALQDLLAADPSAGATDAGTGGLGKDEQDALTPAQKKQLKIVVDAIKREWD